MREADEVGRLMAANMYPLQKNVTPLRQPRMQSKVSAFYILYPLNVGKGQRRVSLAFLSLLNGSSGDSLLVREKVFLYNESKIKLQLCFLKRFWHLKV